MLQVGTRSRWFEWPISGVGRVDTRVLHPSNRQGRCMHAASDNRHAIASRRNMLRPSKEEYCTKFAAPIWSSLSSSSLTRVHS